MKCTPLKEGNMIPRSTAALAVLMIVGVLTATPGRAEVVTI